MIYEYICPSCGSKREENRAVAERDEPLLCHHKARREGVLMRRVIGRGILFTANRLCDLPQNKYALGFDEADRKARRDADFKREEAMCARIQDSTRGMKSQPDDLRDIYHGTV